MKGVTVKTIENSEQIHYSYGSSEAIDRGKNDIIELTEL